MAIKFILLVNNFNPMHELKGETAVIFNDLQPALEKLKFYGKYARIISVHIVEEYTVEEKYSFEIKKKEV